MSETIVQEPSNPLAYARVKCVDFHPTENWVLASLYSGKIILWKGEVQSFDVCEKPLRACKFLSDDKFVCGGDDQRLRVFDFKGTKLHDLEAHSDYIRHLEASETAVLSTSDDKSIKIWDTATWESTILDGHTHYVMMAKFNPTTHGQVASASLDKTIAIWENGGHTLLQGHDRGVNCVAYHPTKPILVSGADDNSLKIWDLTSMVCLHTLTGHSNNVTAVLFHPHFPLTIVSASEDSSVRLWSSIDHGDTFSLETTLNYGLLDRAWSLSAAASGDKLAVGYDKGISLVNLRRNKSDPIWQVSGSILSTISSTTVPLP